MTTLLYATEDWSPPAALDPQQFAISEATGLTNMLETVRTQPVDVVVVESRPWNVSASSLSRWIKCIRRSVRIVLLSDKLLMPHEIPPNVDAVISNEASPETLRDVLTTVVPGPASN